MNIPEQIPNILTMFYKQPKFCVEVDGHKSEYQPQETGIRQGCPLSTYVFIILMTVMFHDIHKSDTLSTISQRIVGTEADEVLYADDTIYIAQTTAAMNRMLEAIETHGKSYGLNLNKAKCEYLAFGKGTGNITFSDGAKVK